MSRCLNSGGRMVRAGRNVKEILIPKTSVTGLGDFARNAGYKTGSITYECETHSFGYDRAIRLFADVMDVEESGVLDCFVEAGAELQRTQVAPEGDAYAFSPIASTEGVTVKGEDLSEAFAVDVLASLRAVTNELDEKQVPTGSRFLFITPTLRGVLDDFSLANPPRSNCVLERFSRIVEVPQVRFYTASDLLSGDDDQFGYQKAAGTHVAITDTKVDPTGYSSASARSYDSIKLLVKKVYIDSSIAGLGITNCNYRFNAFSNCTEVRGFENLSGMTSANQMFTSCGSLETIYATSFSNLGLSGSLMFNSCNCLVGGTDGFVPSTTSGASVCKLGAGGVLTDPNDDGRTWFWAHFYADGEGVLTATSTHDATRELVASGRICAIGKYVGLGFTPWDGVTGPTHRQHLTSASFAADMATFSYLNFNYLFYSCTSLASVNGLGNLSGVRSMRYMFSSCAFTTIDFRGFDPSTLTGLFYTFSGCSKLTTIFADAIWALPTSGISGSQCFYSCSTSLVGGNGTTWASDKTAYTYFRIDTASAPGYITVV